MALTQYGSQQESNLSNNVTEMLTI